MKQSQLHKVIRVSHFERKPELGAYSIERLFSDIRTMMPNDIKVRSWVSSCASRGLWRRLYNIVEAAFRQSDINHVTGDVHFLTYLLHRRRTILTIHDCGSLARLSGFRKWILWLFWYWLPMRHAVAITVISESTKQELLKHVTCNPDVIEVIHDCVSDCFHFGDKEFNACCPRVLQVGTGENKNLERVAAALADIQCCWVIIGRLSEVQRNLIERYSIQYENHIAISDEALIEQYNAADLLVFVSTYEGFGLPIVEANVVGRPVITSNLYSMPEVAGDAACLVDPYNVTCIRQGILRVIEDADYRGHLVRSGIKNARRFSADVVAEQYSHLYRRIYAGQIANCD